MAKLINYVSTKPVTHSALASWASIPKTIAVVLGLVILAILYGLGPGLLPSAGMQQFFLGLASCYAEHLPAFRCDSVGQPDGYVTVFGLPYVLPVAALEWLGLPLFLAGRLVEFFYLGLALIGSLLLIRSFQVRWSIAFLFSFLFLISPIVFAQDGYGPMRIGFLLLPLYSLFDLVIARKIAFSRCTISGIVALFLVLGLIRCFALFLDGYSFIMGLALSAALILPVALKLASGKEWVRIFLIGSGFLISTAFAYLVYGLYAGGSVSASVMELDYFRGQGVDLYAFAVPSFMQWFAVLFDLQHSLTGWMSYSDGPSVTYVYLGWSLIFLIVFGGLIFVFDDISRDRKVLFGALLLVAFGALLLSLGPSLKIADFREDPHPGRFIQHSDYLMPESAATLTLFTQHLYQQVPGVRNMRAVLRWVLLLKLSLLLVGAVLVDHLLKQPRWRIPTYILLLAILLELMPNIPHRLEHGKRQHVQYFEFQKDLLESLQTLDVAGKTVLMMPSYSAESWNHYVANFICPMGEMECFNLGGDKSLMQARKGWPVELRQLSQGRCISSNLRALASNNSFDELLIPLFSLRKASYKWPPASSEVEAYYENALSIAAAAGFDTERHGWFVRFTLLSIEQSEVLRDANVALELAVDRWGPASGSFERGFNLQPDGRSAFWLLFPEGVEPSEDLVLMLDGFALETVYGSGVLSGRLPFENDIQRFPPGVYNLEIEDCATGRRKSIGEFTVVEP